MIIYHAPAGEGLRGGFGPVPTQPPRRNHCRAVSAPLRARWQHTVHTCDQRARHSGTHFCPMCRTEWTRQDLT